MRKSTTLKNYNKLISVSSKWSDLTLISAAQLLNAMTMKNILTWKYSTPTIYKYYIHLQASIFKKLLCTSSVQWWPYVVILLSNNVSNSVNFQLVYISKTLISNTQIQKGKVKRLQISFSFEKPTHRGIIEEWSRLKIVSMHQSTSTSLQVNFLFFVLFLLFFQRWAPGAARLRYMYEWSWLVTCMNEAGCQCAPGAAGIITCMKLAGYMHDWSWLVTCMNEAGCRCAPGIITYVNETGWLHAWMKVAGYMHEWSWLAGVHQVQLESLHAWMKLAGYMHEWSWLPVCTKSCYMHEAGCQCAPRVVTCMNEAAASVHQALLHVWMKLAATWKKVKNAH